MLGFPYLPPLPHHQPEEKGDLYTKSITLEGTNGAGFGSSLSSGVTCFNVNITTTANDPLRTVRLRNLSLTGTGKSGTIGTRTGINGVRVLSSTAANTVVYVENTIITDFTNRGISFEANSGDKLYVTDTTIRNIINHNTTGILSGLGPVVVRLSDNSVQNTANGVNVTSGTVVTYGTNRIDGNTTADVTGLLTAAGGPTSELGTK